MIPPEPPDILPCEFDPDVECVRVGSRAEDATAAPPSGGSKAEGGQPLCPEGYVPRRRGDRGYSLEGKRVHKTSPPVRNPNSET
jgi:hypothetical protein